MVSADEMGDGSGGREDSPLGDVASRGGGGDTGVDDGSPERCSKGAAGEARMLLHEDVEEIGRVEVIERAEQLP